MAKLKVEGFTNLVRDLSSSAIVNTNQSEYLSYMRKVRARQEQSDEIRSAVKEINTLKMELYEIKNLLKEVIKK